MGQAPDQLYLTAHGFSKYRNKLLFESRLQVKAKKGSHTFNRKSNCDINNGFIFKSLTGIQKIILTIQILQRNSSVIPSVRH